MERSWALASRVPRERTQEKEVVADDDEHDDQESQDEDVSVGAAHQRSLPGRSTRAWYLSSCTPVSAASVGDPPSSLTSVPFSPATVISSEATSKLIAGCGERLPIELG